MSLYLVILDDEEQEIAACDVGHYSDFGCFRDTIRSIANEREYPILMGHSDCDGEWRVDELTQLKAELTSLARLFRALPPEEPKHGFEHAAERRLNAESLFDCFHTVDGQNLFESLIELCDAGLSARRPILFQ
jgi:hypothetical protein